MDDVAINPGETADRAEEHASESSEAETPLFDESDNSEYRATFQYMPLEPSSNSIRLVVLQPNEGDHDSEIVCRITHTTFGAKPVYEALSYTWGDETIKRNINLDGCVFAVSNNLHEALSHLRTSSAERILWIDAISINQTDTDEKNSQIRMMPFIYKRAESVVVWLGSGIDFNPGESEYWRRVWVIQEFGMARRLMVYWAFPGLPGFKNWETYRLSWDELVGDTYSYEKTLFPLSANVLKFKKLRETRYLASRLLRNLLKDHQDAECKDPRDKIYALVGLSTDCFRLPMDYRKTFWEVYKDVITFHNLDREILGLSKLLRILIGGPDKIPRWVLEEGKGTLERVLKPSDPTTVKLPTSFLGTIVHLGPTYNEIISSFERASDWEETIEQLLANHEPESKREQSDLFLEALEAISEEVLDARLSRSQTIAWRHRSVDNERSCQFTTMSSKFKFNTNEYSRTSPTLFLIKDEEKSYPETPIGVACKGAKLGDLVFQVPGFDLAMVVRCQGIEWILVGYAGMAMNAERRKSTGKPQKNSKGLFNIPDSNTWKIFEICLDMATLYNISD
jgi:hypothetical protein